MQIIGAFDAETRFSELLDRAERGESFLITKDGRPVGKLVPPDQENDLQVAEGAGILRSFRGAMRDLTIEEFRACRDEGRRF